MRNKVVAMFVAAVISQAAFAQDASQGGADELEQVVVTGTRVANRSALDTAVPVDVVKSDELTNLGVAEINQALSVALPSFSFPRPGLADGTDTVRPATLRGMSPDQTLVLVNGKRRHTAALVNVNGTVGRGSAAVDLNTIPTTGVRTVEVLRDGAAAQYGSDAIAGVINLRMREDRDGGELNLSYGWRDTEYDVFTEAPPAGAAWSAPTVFSRSRSDGKTLTVSGWKGFSLGDSGFVTISAEFKDQERTERGGYDMRQQYALVAGAFDPRELTFNRWSQWYGEPEVKQSTVFVNAGMDLSDSSSLYGWASYQDRSALSAGFYRRSNDGDGRNVLSIYPDGFLPKIAPDVIDYSLGLGSRWSMGEWDMDASVVYGYNEMMFTIVDTLNRSLGASSKKQFDAGGYDYDQLVFNLSGVRTLELSGLASPLNLALGIEARREAYSITAGEPDSYRNGGVLLPLGSLGCTAPTAAQTAGGGCAAASGAQVFPGFRPQNAVSESRNAVGAYIDLEANITDRLLASAAFRAEDYSDFGGNVSGKIAARYDFADNFALRTSYSTGFRAPSLQQQYFTTTSTNFISGVPFDVTTFPVADPVAVALGAQPLEAEKADNVSLGLVFQAAGGASLTLDAYKIDMENRIILSENLTGASLRNLLTLQGVALVNGVTTVGGARFFINGIDTATEGLDVVFNYPIQTDGAGKFDITATANFTDTDITKIPETRQVSALNPAPRLLDHVNFLLLEEASPKDKYALSVTWALERFGLTARATRYGKMISPNAPPSVPSSFPSGTLFFLPLGVSDADVVLTPKTLVDLEFRYEISDRLRVAFGADNLFDTYPTMNPIRIPGVSMQAVSPAGTSTTVQATTQTIGVNTTGASSFSNSSPFGRSGRFVYGRVTFGF